MEIMKYFDWAATTPPDGDILEKALSISQKSWGNPSSIYEFGKTARQVLDEARARAATALGCKAEQIFFTSGGTESDHLPMLSILNRPQRGTVLISAIEHPAIREMKSSLKNCGWNVAVIPSDSRGIITKDAVMNALTDDTVLVCVMAVNNETGVVQPAYEIADALTARAKETGKRRALLHVDCVQAIGKIPFDLTHKGIYSAAISAHKICGPRGIGILYLAEGAKTFAAFTKGGGQEQNVRSGTENLFGAVALSLCLERYAIPPASGGHSASGSPFESGSSSASGSYNHTIARYNKQKKYTENFIEQLKQIDGCVIVPECRAVSGDSELFSPWIVQAAFKNIPGQVMVRALDAEGFSISTGSACSATKQSRPILEAMHVPPAIRDNAVRFSFGTHTTENDMNTLLDAVRTVAEKFK